MSRRSALISLFLMVSGIVFFLFGCYPAVVRVSPPPPRVEVYGPSPYPEAVWRPGYWAYRGEDWVWVPGHWARRPAPGAIWVPGRWERRGDGWVWHDGHWEHR